MNRLNKIESAVFNIVGSLFPNDPFFPDYLFVVHFASCVCLPMRKRELVALLLLCSECHVTVIVL